MKAITAVIKPFKLDDVKEGLKDVGVISFTVTESKGFGIQKGHTELYKGVEYVVDFLPKLMIYVLVADEVASKAVEAICRSARTGKIGDGIVAVTDVGTCISIQTGKSLLDAAPDQA